MLKEINHYRFIDDGLNIVTSANIVDPSMVYTYTFFLFFLFAFYFDYLHVRIIRQD